MRLLLLLLQVCKNTPVENDFNFIFYAHIFNLIICVCVCETQSVYACLRKILQWLYQLFRFVYAKKNKIASKK